MIKNKLLRVVTGVIAVLLMLTGAFWLGFGAGQNVPRVITIQDVKNITPEKTNVADFSTFWQAWDVIGQIHLNAGKIGNQERVYGAISGLVKSLKDPHSEFFKPDDGKKFEEDIQGNFGGIGAEIGTKNDSLIIIAPLKDTPASRAGLKPKDIILKINASSTEGIDVGEAVKLIRGVIGTKVTLTVLREGWEKPKDFAIIRDTIVIPTLDFEIKEGDIAYISLHSFNSNSNLLFYEAMLKALGKGSRGLVLDLRNNPGGYLQVSIDLAGWFLPRNTLVISEVYRNKSSEEFRSKGNAALKDFPVVVLVNSGSASASEILAGTLRDNRQIKLVGEQTFGKGTVQQLETLKDGSSLKLTTANWVLPSGETIENKGLKPDFEVKITDEDVDEKRDPQLEKALEILKGEVKKNRNLIFVI